MLDRSAFTHVTSFAPARNAPKRNANPSQAILPTQRPGQYDTHNCTLVGTIVLLDEKSSTLTACLVIWCAVNTTRISVLLTQDEFDRFESYCESFGHKKSTLIARLIREHLDRQGFAHQESLGFDEKPTSQKDES